MSGASLEAALGAGALLGTATLGVPELALVDVETSVVTDGAGTAEFCARSQATSPVVHNRVITNGVRARRQVRVERTEMAGMATVYAQSSTCVAQSAQTSPRSRDELLGLKN